MAGGATIRNLTFENEWDNYLCLRHKIIDFGAGKKLFSYQLKIIFF